MFTSPHEASVLNKIIQCRGPEVQKHDHICNFFWVSFNAACVSYAVVLHLRGTAATAARRQLGGKNTVTVIFKTCELIRMQRRLVIGLTED